MHFHPGVKKTSGYTAATTTTAIIAHPGVLSLVVLSVVQMASALSVCLCFTFSVFVNGQRTLVNDRTATKSSGCGKSPGISSGKTTSMSGTFDGTKRKWRVYLPSNYDKNSAFVSLVWLMILFRYS